MRLAISNIAWNPDEDEIIANLLTRHFIDAIDIAPGKYFGSSPSDADILKRKQWWSDRGVVITGMQSLLFGTTGLNVFGDVSSQRSMLEHLTDVCRIGSGLGATRLAFGSPKNRDRSGLSNQEAMDVATAFFRRLGDIAQRAGVTVCLEPNPERYGANFMTTAQATADVVNATAHAAIRMQLDAGALTINGEHPETVVKEYAALIGHVHASEPDLVPLGVGGTAHADVAKALHTYLPAHVVTIEMVATNDEPHATSIERALRTAIQYYRPVPAGERT